jgi:hypothetical protein
MSQSGIVDFSRKNAAARLDLLGRSREGPRTDGRLEGTGNANLSPKRILPRLGALSRLAELSGKVFQLLRVSNTEGHGFPTDYRLPATDNWFFTTEGAEITEGRRRADDRGPQAGEGRPEASLFNPKSCHCEPVRLRSEPALSTAERDRLRAAITDPRGSASGQTVPLPLLRVARIVPEFWARVTSKNRATPCAQRNKESFSRGVFYLFNCCTNAIFGVCLMEDAPAYSPSITRCKRDTQVCGRTAILAPFRVSSRTTSEPS